MDQRAFRFASKMFVLHLPFLFLGTKGNFDIIWPKYLTLFRQLLAKCVRKSSQRGKFFGPPLKAQNVSLLPSKMMKGKSYKEATV